jgi:hypothetical protein
MRGVFNLYLSIQSPSEKKGRRKKIEEQSLLGSGNAVISTTTCQINIFPDPGTVGYHLCGILGRRQPLILAD